MKFGKDDSILDIAELDGFKPDENALGIHGDVQYQ